MNFVSGSRWRNFLKISVQFSRENIAMIGTKIPDTVIYQTRFHRDSFSAAVKVPICFYPFLPTPCGIFDCILFSLDSSTLKPSREDNFFSHFSFQNVKKFFDYFTYFKFWARTYDVHIGLRNDKVSYVASKIDTTTLCLLHKFWIEFQCCFLSIEHSVHWVHSIQTS